MSTPITVRLWLTEPTSSEAETVAKRRALLKPQLDQQSANYYVEFRGHDAFAIARTVPQELVQLVTVRHTLKEQMLPQRSSARGVYVHDNVEVIFENDDGGMSEMRTIFITGSNIAKVQEAYTLFREGKLFKSHIRVRCPRCGETIGTTQSALKKRNTASGGTQYYIACPACGADCHAVFAGDEAIMSPETRQ